MALPFVLSTISKIHSEHLNWEGIDASLNLFELKREDVHEIRNINSAGKNKIFMFFFLSDEVRYFFRSKASATAPVHLASGETTRHPPDK